ncbi:hypothetical protein [Persicobacter diffluens]|uniref:Uncharacterized protein n=1 Tax=Persicobacter diffluens TaxID=981 RepID=A0AAN4W613_9BACT|nr:hypothetical protein PEDI_50920 [Persicobacter diffluens]GJM64775.1 hypothetical protein PEDI_53270 [Persicobacter diffluens]
MSYSLEEKKETSYEEQSNDFSFATAVPQLEAVPDKIAVAQEQYLPDIQRVYLAPQPAQIQLVSEIADDNVKKGFVFLTTAMAGEETKVNIQKRGFGSRDSSGYADLLLTVLQNQLLDAQPMIGIYGNLYFQKPNLFTGEVALFDGVFIPDDYVAIEDVVKLAQQERGAEEVYKKQKEAELVLNAYMRDVPRDLDYSEMAKVLFESANIENPKSYAFQKRIQQLAEEKEQEGWGILELLWKY